MKYQHTLAAGLCGFVLLSGFSVTTAQAQATTKNASAAKPAPIKPRTFRTRITETVVDLTPEGVKLEAGYNAMLESLRADLIKAIPAVDPAKQAQLISLLKAELVAGKELAELDKALRNTRASEDKYTALVEKLRAAPALVAKHEKSLQAAMALPDSDPNKAKTVTKLEKTVANAKKQLTKLPNDIAKAKQVFENAGAEEAKLMKAAEIASKSNDKAKQETWKALDALGLNNLLGSDKLDTKLAQYIILSEGKPRFLAQFAQQGPEKKKLIDQLLANTPLMLQMLVADGAYWGKYGEAMEIYQAIQKASPKASTGVLQRLAVAISIVHAVPMIERKSSTAAATDTQKTIDPVKRYLHFEKAFLAGELDPAFKDLSTWELTFVIEGNDPDEAYAWGREMMRTYRPDMMKRGYTELRYTQIVDGEIQYGSQFVPEDRPELMFMQNVFSNGGICGRRGFFGTFMLRSFGIPSSERPEPGHSTLAQWTPEGWQTYLGGNWGGRGKVGRYGRDLHFIASAIARQNEKEFMKVKRAQWIGDLMGEPMVFGLQEPKEEPQLWYAVSIAEQDRSGHGKKPVPQYKMPAPTPVTPPPASETVVTVDSAGVITIPAVATKIPEDNIGSSGWGNMNVVTFMESNLGGMQLHYSRYGKTQVLEYHFEAPKAGKYELTSRIASNRWDMELLVSANGASPVEMPIPFNVGLWETSEPVVIELKAGSNTLTFARAQDMRKGIAIKDFTLTPVK